MELLQSECLSIVLSLRVLRSVLFVFNIHINDIDVGLNSLNRFADDTEIGTSVLSVKSKLQ